MRKKRIKRFAPIVPGIFTMGNMFAGFVSILHSTGGKPISGAWLIILGGVFDLLDGKIARMTRATSEIGVQLDSFSDFLTFGVAPGILLFSIDVYSFKNWSFLVPPLFLIAGAFRLARYNVSASPHSKTDFQGLPIPLAAIFIASFVIFSNSVWGEIRFTRFFTPAVVLLSWLMVSNVRYSATLPIPSGKNLILKSLVFIIIVVALLVRPRWFLFPVVTLYILQGFVREIFWVAKKFNGQEESDEVCG